MNWNVRVFKPQVSRSEEEVAQAKKSNWRTAETIMCEGVRQSHFTGNLTVYADGRMSCEWLPDTPDRKNPLSKRGLQQYQQARNRCIQRCADYIGGNVAVAE